MKKAPIIIFTTISILFFSVVCNADSPIRPKSRFYSSQNGKFVFVLLISDSELEVLRNLLEFDKKNLQNSSVPPHKRKGIEAKLDTEFLRELKLRERYRTSGLFWRGNPQKLLWSYDWKYGQLILGGDIKVANDGIHLVQKNGWISRKPYENEPDWNQEVLSFISSGKKIRSYRAGDLVLKNEKLEGTASGYYWNRGDGYLNNKNNTFTIRKVNGEKLTFSTNTGDLISGKEDFRLRRSLTTACTRPESACLSCKSCW